MTRSREIKSNVVINAIKEPSGSFENFGIHRDWRVLLIESYLRQFFPKYNFKLNIGFVRRREGVLEIKSNLGIKPRNLSFLKDYLSKFSLFDIYLEIHPELIQETK